MHPQNFTHPLLINFWCLIFRQQKGARRDAHTMEFVEPKWDWLSIPTFARLWQGQKSNRWQLHQFFAPNFGVLKINRMKTGEPQTIPPCLKT